MDENHEKITWKAHLIRKTTLQTKRHPDWLSTLLSCILIVRYKMLVIYLQHSV